jgi:hypothetical protein
MPTSLSIDRPISLCTFTFSDGRRCRTPRTARHQHLCTYHARKESQTRAAEKVGQDIAYDLSGSVTTASDLTSALRHLFTAVAQGHIKPKTANTLAYLAQTLVQSIRLSQGEYIDAFGKDAWHEEVEGHLYPDAQEPQPAQLPAPATPSAPIRDTPADERANPEQHTETAQEAETEESEETEHNDRPDPNDNSSETGPEPGPGPNLPQRAMQGGNHLTNKPPS